MPDKSSRELYLLERFLPELLEGKPHLLSQPEPPLPDVVIQVDGRRIGIEITDIIPDVKARKREAVQDAVLREAQSMFEKRHQLPLHVTVDFTEAMNWKNSICQSAASALAKTVEQHVLAVKDLPQNHQQFNLRIDTVAHSYIRSISISYLDRLTVPCWSPITSFWVPNVPEDVIRGILLRKSQNVSGYLAGCDEVWLLMLERGSPSSYFDGFEKLATINFTSAFDKTMIGRIPTGELITLQTG